MSMRKGSFYILFLGCLLGLAACLDEREPDILAPELEIGEATGITRNAAHVNGFVWLQGEGAVAACHFVCDTTPALTGGRRVEADALTGEVGANLDSLKAGTDYYYCVEISNGYSVVRSESAHFRTEPNTRPALGATELVSKGPTTVVLGSRLLDDGGVRLMEVGFRYQAEGESKVHFVAAEVAEDNSFQVRLAGLRLATSYSAWTYASNEMGATVADTVWFTTDEAIYVTQPGTLEEVIGEQEKYDLDSISVAGMLNGTDIRFLREMFGQDVEGGDTPGNLRILDLSGASIVEGGEAYFASHYAQRNVIGRSMFQGCSRLEKIVLPNTVTVIEEDAFSGCSSLEVLTLPDDLVEFNPSAGCAALREFRVSVMNDRFRTKEGVLFDASGDSLLAYPCGREAEVYAIPDGVRVIGERAFLSAGVDEVDFPASVSVLGRAAFSRSALRTVVVPDAVRYLLEATFQNCQWLTSVTIGADVWSIGSSCFAGCPLRELRVLAEAPPVCAQTAFDASVFESCDIYVPAASKSTYRGTNVWKLFPLILEL